MASPAKQPVVFVVDDDTAVRTTVCALLKSIGLTSQPLASAQEFFSGFDPAQPGCVVLDIRMPGMSGLEMQEQLNRLGAIIPVIFVTGHGDVPMAVGAMRHGAFDFLQKPFREQDLLDRVQRALARDRENRLALREHGLIRERLASLTPRESEVLRLMTEGKANKVIASELGLSQRTVELHRAHVMEKMGAHSLAQLVRMVLDTQP